MSVVVKTVFDGTIRKFSLTKPSFDELEAALSSIYGKRFCVRYQDEDGDLITISSSLELQQALRVPNLKLNLSVGDLDSPVKIHAVAPKVDKVQAFDVDETREVPTDALQVDGVVGPQSREGGCRCLVRGAHGDAVKELQQALKIPVVGFFGSQTEEAVKEFQAAQGLSVDGVFGPRTRSKLFPQAAKPEEKKREKPAEEKKREKPAEKKEVATEKPWLSAGATGESVKELQRALGIHDDGIFGRLTDGAVREFQFTNSLPMDGTVGPHIWAKLAPAEKTWLKAGATGEEVKQLQRALGIHVDGVFGRLTDGAVRDFQFTNELDMDGAVGPRTWAKLAPEKPWVSAGATGKDVEEIQRVLGIHVDGIFGRLTDGAVRDFQFTHDLAMDGAVGPRTWSKLTQVQPSQSEAPKTASASTTSR